MPFPGPSEWSSWTLARNFIPKQYWGLPLARFFLPIRIGEEVLRWSEIVPSDELATASLEEIRAGQEHLVSNSFQSVESVLDAKTSSALKEVMGGLNLDAAWWQGYGEQVEGITWEISSDYVRSPFIPAHLREGSRLPEFCWDAESSFAWGGRLYPDSFVIASSKSRLGDMLSHPHLDIVGIDAARSFLPLSIND